MSPLMAHRMHFKKNNAVTFIELFVVVILISILTSLTIPQLKKTLENFELEGFAKKIYILSHYLQESAITQGKIFCLNINKEQGELKAGYEEEGEFKTLSGSLAKVYRAPVGISILPDPVDKEDIFFYPDASITSMSINFTNQRKNTITLTIKGAGGEIKLH